MFLNNFKILTFLTCFNFFQNNVYLTAQRRKMRHFQGFQRKAVVIVPSDEEFQTRTTKPEYVENKCNDSTVQEMKGVLNCYC